MFVHMRCAEMIRQGIEVEVFVPSTQNKTYEYEGVEVKMMPTKEIVKNISTDSVLYLHLLNIYPFSKSDGWHIYKRIIKNNIPFAMYVHGSEVQKFLSRTFDFNLSASTFLKWFKKDILVIPKMKKFVTKTKGRKNTKYIFPSYWMKDELEKNLSTRIEDFQIIPNGIDTELFHYHNCFDNRFKMLTLRPLSGKKYAVDIAIDVVKYLPDNYTLTIFGKGKFQKKYEQQIKDNKLEKRVVIKNSFIERGDLNNVFSKYGIFLSPTRMDAQGVTMCEAMASGLLTASNNNTAIPEFITHGVSGILGETSKEIAEGIMQAAESEIKFNNLTSNAREAMENIAIKKTVTAEVLELKKVLMSKLD